jgi:hypothetical protein
MPELWQIQIDALSHPATWLVAALVLSVAGLAYAMDRWL